MEAPLTPPAPLAAPAEIRDRRGGGIAGTIASLVACGAPVLVVAADAPARARHLAPILGGFALCSHAALERDPSLAGVGGDGLHVVFLDPPAGPVVARGRMTHLAWGEPELRFSQQIHEREFALRAPLTATYRALRDAGGAAGEELEALLRGDPRAPRPAALAGRAPQGPRRAPPRQPRPGPEDRRRPGRRAHRARALGGVPGLPAAIRGRTQIPQRGDSTGGVKAAPRVPGNGRRKPVDQVSADRHPAVSRADLTDIERRLLSDVFAIVEEHADEAAVRDRPQASVEAAFVFSLRAPCRPAAQVRRGLHRPPGRGREDLRRHAPRHRDALCRAAARHRRGHDRVAGGGPPRVRRRDRLARRRRHEADRHHLPVARRGAGGELPQDDGRDGLRRAGHPHQARRPPAQHAHDRRDAQAEADRQGQGDPGDLRADRAPPRHPRDQVGARGPRLRRAAPAQVPGDQGPGQPAARGARGLRREGRHLPAARARRARHRGARSPAAPSTSIRSTRR